MKKILLGVIVYIIIMHDMYIIGNEAAFFIVGAALYFLLNIMTTKIELSEKTFFWNSPSMEWFMHLILACPMYIIVWAVRITQKPTECHYHID